MFWRKRKYTLEVRAGKRGKFRWWARDEFDAELCQGPVKGFETELLARVHAARVFGLNWKLVDWKLAE